MDDRDGRPPVALAGDQPVAQPERDGGTAEPLLLEPFRDLRDRRGRALAVEGSGVHHHAFVVVAPPSSTRDRAPRPAAGSPPGSRGRAHERTRSLAGRAPARPSRRRCRTPSARTAPRTPAPAHRSRGSRRGRRGGTPSRLSACSRFVSGVACRRSTSSRAASEVPPASASFATSGCSGANTKNVTPQSVSGTRREDLDLVARLLDRESDRRALRSTDPVPLHRDHALRPLLEGVHVVDQALRVVGDLEEPLGEVLPDDRRAASLAEAVDHLLVGKHGLIVRAPVGRGVLPVRQPHLEELQEQPLGPAVVLGVARLQSAGPVERTSPSV